MRKFHYLLMFVLVLFLVDSCTNDPYESGDGEYSYLHAEFVEARTAADATISEAWTDAGEHLQFSAFSCSWATVPDSVYRGLLYYNKVNAAAPEILSMAQVSVLNYKVATDTMTVYTDPVTLESAWVSPNGKYYNLGIILKTGQEEGVDARQVIGLVCDSIVDAPSGAKDYYFRFYHQQNGVPQYYSSRTYASIPLAEFRQGDAFHLSVNTYDGLMTKDYRMD